MGTLLDMFMPPEGVDLSWRDDALCTGLYKTMDFHSRKARDVAAAKAVCQDCPVRSECLEEALLWPRYQDQGVRGGLSEGERVRLRQGLGRKNSHGIDHGTTAGYRAHKRRGEDACPSCLEAERLHYRHRT